MSIDYTNYKLSVIGAGQMGSGIAQVFASRGISVQLIDSSSKQLENAQQGIALSVAKLVDKKKLDPNVSVLVKDKIQFSQRIEFCSDSDLIIEAVNENEELKRSIFSQVDKVAKDSAIIGSNTSSISIAQLAKSTNRGKRFLGIHFMNPVPIMQLVELITTFNTEKSVCSEVKSLLNYLNKTIVVSKDYPGFIVNRILMPMINDAFKTLLEGVASAEDIDQAMKLGTNQPMGPLELADFIGLDTCLAIMEVLYKGFADTRYSPSPLLRAYVDSGFLGRKTKKGVYSY